MKKKVIQKGSDVDLELYLFKNKIQRKVFAKSVGISESHMSSLVHKKVNPNILTAIKIIDCSEKQVTLKELVRMKDRLEE